MTKRKPLTPLILTWDDFDEAVAILAKRAREVGATTVYGIPRGGLPLAVAISHAADIPVELVSPLAGLWTTSTTFIVDDIGDSGATLMRFENHPEEMKAVWIRRRGCPVPVWAARLERTARWLVFPWERKEKAVLDQQDYLTRRAI